MDPLPAPLLSIGQFARRIGLTVSTVRFYADCGLLIPARVDPQTGYRSYAPEQLALGEQIAALRALGMPLAELTTLVGGPPERGAQLLADHERRLYALFQQQRALLRRVSALVDERRVLPPIEAESCVWPAQRVLSVTASATAEAFGTRYGSALDGLRRQVAAAGGAVAGPHFGLYPPGEYLGGPLQVEVCLPVAAPVAVSAPARLVQLPQQRVVSTVHRGDWTTFSLTFAALHAALHAAGEVTPGSSFTRAHPDGTELGLLLD